MYPNKTRPIQGSTMDVSPTLLPREAMTLEEYQRLGCGAVLVESDFLEMSSTQDALEDMAYVNENPSI